MNYLVLAMSIVLSVACGYYGYKIVSLYNRVKKRPRAWARVLNKRVVTRTLSSSSRAQWTVNAEYEYLVSGVKRKGSKIFLIEFLKGEKGYLKKNAQQFIDRLPAEVEIYYDPDTEDSVIYCDSSMMGVLLLFFSVIILFIGVTHFLYGK